MPSEYTKISEYLMTRVAKRFATARLGNDWSQFTASVCREGYHHVKVEVKVTPPEQRYDGLFFLRLRIWAVHKTRAEATVRWVGGECQYKTVMRNNWGRPHKYTAAFGKLSQCLECVEIKLVNAIKRAHIEDIYVPRNSPPPTKEWELADDLRVAKLELAGTIEKLHNRLQHLKESYDRMSTGMTSHYHSMTETFEDFVEEDYWHRRLKVSVDHWIDVIKQKEQRLAEIAA